MMKTTEKTYEANEILDLRGWGCPWVILKAKSWLNRMSSGEILEVISSDDQIEKSFSSYFRENQRQGDQRKSTEGMLSRIGEEEDNVCTVLDVICLELEAEPCNQNQ